METSQLLAHCGTSRMSREELRTLPIPARTATYQPLPHHQIVEALIESLSFRHISVVRDEYAVSADGMKMFGVLNLETTFEGCRFSVGIRNANDKSMRLGLTRRISRHGLRQQGLLWRLHSGIGEAHQTSKSG